MGRVAVSADHLHLLEHPGAATDNSKQDWPMLGMVLGLRTRQPGAAEPTIVTSLDAIAGIGLSSDSHADALSPRQVLLAGSDAYDELGLPPQTLRENLLVDFATARLPSNAILSVGDDVLLRTTFQCEPCGRLEGHHPGVLKRIGARRGMLARVARGGRIRVGDTVRCRLSGAEPLADAWQERILQVLARVPRGRQVEYRHLAKLAGVPKVYCRVFPKVLASASADVAARAQAGTVDESRRWMGQELHRREDEAALRELAEIRDDGDGPSSIGRMPCQTK
jgi:alkylated DNA nucleotide flippase Atl1